MSSAKQFIPTTIGRSYVRTTHIQLGDTATQVYKTYIFVRMYLLSIMTESDSCVASTERNEPQYVLYWAVNYEFICEWVGERKAPQALQSPVTPSRTETEVGRDGLGKAWTQFPYQCTLSGRQLVNLS
jgi:hypothetical protein